MSDTPFISVIITAYNRKQYLLNAFKSAYNQTLSKDKYEIIVTKNFKDNNIDTFIKGHGGKLVFFKQGTTGAQWTDVLKYVKGEVLCFLDDDDLFLKQKLAIIYKLFEENDELGYVNNARYYIDENNRRFVKSVNKFEKIESAFIEQRSLLKLLLLDIRVPWSNASSISIKKSLLIKYFNQLKKVTYTPDLFLYLISLDSKLSLMLTGKKLTQYRIHSSTSVSFNLYENFKETALKMTYADLKISKELYKSFKSTEIKKYLKIHIREKSIDYLFYKCNCRKTVLLNYIKNLPYLIIARPKLTLLSGLQILFYIIAPEKFRRFNYMRIKNYLLQIKSN